MFDLKTSTNFGSSYQIVDSDPDLFKLRKRVEKIDKKMDRRWVIVNEEDIPLLWCDYVEESFQQNKDTIIASEDIYVHKIGKLKGYKVMTTLALIKAAMSESK